MKEGNRIRTIRQQHHLSAEKLATLTGLTSQAIFRYELRPIENVPVGALDRIANALGIDRDALLLKTYRFPDDEMQAYLRPDETILPMVMTVPVSANSVYGWLEECRDPGRLRYLGRAALRFADKIENPDNSSQLGA